MITSATKKLPLFQVSWTKDGNYLKTENYAAVENEGAGFEGEGEHILSITSLDETGIYYF